MHERSFGIIPLKHLKKDWHILLVQKNEGHWGFPKGHAEPGESPKDTAERELIEETGLIVKEWIPLPPLLEHYILTRWGRKTSKTVTYFVGRVQGRVEIDHFELKASCWTPLRDAEELVTYPESKKVCRQLVINLRTGVMK